MITAYCPSDRMVTFWLVDEQDVRECTSCGFTVEPFPLDLKAFGDLVTEALREEPKEEGS